MSNDCDIFLEDEEIADLTRNNAHSHWELLLQTNELVAGGRGEEKIRKTY